MNIEEVKKAQRDAGIMGVMYIMIRAQELNGGTVIHQGLNYDTCVEAHCTYQELIDVMNEMVRCSGIVKHFLEVRGELKQ